MGKMDILKDKINREGIVIDNRILRVDMFLKSSVRHESIH